MTFSDPKVAEFVNTHFVAAWFNRSPGFHDTNFAPEKQIFNFSHEAYATKNICTFFLAPDGSAFHYAAGYYAPALFSEVLDAALRLRQAAFDDDMKLKRDGAESLRRVHAELAASFKKRTIADLKELPGEDAPAYRGEAHKHSDRCLRIVAEAWEYFERLHGKLSGLQELPRIADLRFKYLYGNEFTEESTGGTLIARDDSLPQTNG